MAPVPTVTSAGAVMVGGVVSLPQVFELTVTFCAQLAVRPSASVTVQVMPVTPTGYGSVSGTSCAGVARLPSSSERPGMLSLRPPWMVAPLPEAVKVGVPTATVSLPLLSVSMAVLSVGQEMVGAAVPTTLTVKVQLSPVAPLSPGADAVTVVVPTAKKVPEAGELLTAPQSPETEADEKVTNAPKLPLTVVFAVATPFAGQVRLHLVGGAAAVTCALALADLSLVVRWAVVLVTLELLLTKPPAAAVTS